MRGVGPVMLALLLATALALLSSRIERRGPEQVAYGNLCGPTSSDPCYWPVLKGGFPVAFLFDAAGVSVEDKLAFVEDHFHAGAFALDVALYFAAAMLGLWIVSGRSSRSSSPGRRPQARGRCRA